MLIPQQTYRWLVSLKVIPNEGQLTERSVVILPQAVLERFQSGFLIAQIVKSILQRSEQKIPPCLGNVRNDNAKNVKSSNWNFVWISFEDLRMHFDVRIRDLILKGETTLIIQIIKQLCDRDENKDHEEMKQIVIREKLVGSKVDKIPITHNKPSVLDLKRVNLQKNPDDAESSLQFLVLLLTSAFNMSLEEVLGLLTNQNKYLAHLIVKGINEDFTAILLFYTLLNKHSKRLNEFCLNDKKDADSCLYAVKPGFLSKSEEVAKMTISLFRKIESLYSWFINEDVSGSKTLFLGMRRHPTLIKSFWDLFLTIIQNEEIEFFTTYYKKNFKDPIELLQICSLMIKPISESSICDQLLNVGIFADWFEIGGNLFGEKVIENKILCYRFLGEAMLHIPQSITQNEECLKMMKTGWVERNLIEFSTLFVEMMNILEKLAAKKNSLASKLYHIIIQMFKMVENEENKKEIIIQNFIPILSEHPKLPSEYLIETFRFKYLQPSDQLLISMTIKNASSPQSLVKIGDITLSAFLHDPVLNDQSAVFIYEIAKKVIDDEIGQAYISKVVKDCLYKYGVHETHKKNLHKLKNQPLYFGHKGNTSKVVPEETVSHLIKQKEGENLFYLVEKLTDLSILLEDDSLKEKLKSEFLNRNAYIKKHNFKTGGKELSSIMRKVKITKEEEEEFEEEYRLKQSLLDESMIKRTKMSSYIGTSRFAGPAYLRKEFDDITKKRKMEEEWKKIEEEKKEREEKVKKQNVQKELKKMKMLRGVGGAQADLREDGFWERQLKEDKEIQIYNPNLIEQRDLDYIQYIFRRYHRVLRFLFLKYTSTMYSVKNVNNFQENQNRKEIITAVELMKFMKDYRLHFFASSHDVQHLVREINSKIYNKRQNQDLDFHGFEQFIIQFSILYLTKPFTISSREVKGAFENKSYKHLNHGELVEQFFNFLKLIFLEKGEKTVMFDEPEAAYFNQSEVIKQFNRQLEEDPDFILPDGYKKVSEKIVAFSPKISQNIYKSINPAYVEVIEILDEIIKFSLDFHLLEPMAEKRTKVRAKPHAFLNIKSKINGETETEKLRAFSSVTERKAAIPPIKMLQRKVLSLGMKLGLSKVSYKDKLLGEQVAYVIDDMLTAVETGKQTIAKQKIVNFAMKKRIEKKENLKKEEEEREKKIKDRKQELSKMKKEYEQKKVKELQDTKEERERKRQKEASREKKKREEMEKYVAEQKQKLKQKKEKDEEENKKVKEELKKKRSEKKKAKELYLQKSKEQIEVLKREFEEKNEDKKRKQEQDKAAQKKKEELYKKLRNKSNANYQKFNEIQKKNNQQISSLYHSPEITEVFSQFYSSIKAIFDFLIRYNFQSLAEMSNNYEIPKQVWVYFNKSFELSPYILHPSQISAIFISLTKNKQVTKEYKMGLNFKEFEEALLRVAIKHKTIFNKISQNIKDETVDKEQVNEIVKKEKEENEFGDNSDVNTKTITIETDVIQDAYIDYGDIKKVTPQTLKGLIYYLKVPKDKLSQEKRFKEILEWKPQKKVLKHEKLKQKLKAEYSLSPTVKRKVQKNQSVSQPIKLEESQVEEGQGEGDKKQ